MWILVMFDLPVTTKKKRKEYAIFRKKLLQAGFQMMQYSVYFRHCPSKENTEVHAIRVKREIPPEGEVRILEITDKQFERMQVFFGKKRKKVEKAPAQLEFF